jgi:hypothetical protein
MEENMRTPPTHGPNYFTSIEPIPALPWRRVLAWANLLAWVIALALVAL